MLVFNVFMLAISGLTVNFVICGKIPDVIVVDERSDNFDEKHNTAELFDEKNHPHILVPIMDDEPIIIEELEDDESEENNFNDETPKYYLVIPEKAEKVIDAELERKPHDITSTRVAKNVHKKECPYATIKKESRKKKETYLPHHHRDLSFADQPEQGIWAWRGKKEVDSRSEEREVLKYPEIKKNNRKDAGESYRASKNEISKRNRIAKLFRKPDALSKRKMVIAKTTVVNDHKQKRKVSLGLDDLDLSKANV